MTDKPQAPHAVASTGAKSQPLVGGRSRFTANGVPILEVRDELVERLAHAQRKLLAPDEETAYLTGHYVVMHNPRPQYPVNPALASAEGADCVMFHVGGETLDEAAKSCVGAFEGAYGHEPPTWVASTDSDLAEVIADHYGCPVKGMDEELAP